MLWNEYGETRDGHLHNAIWWRTSGDGGNTWSEDARVNPTGERGIPYHGEPMRVLSTGRIVLPVRMWFNCDSSVLQHPWAYSVGWWKGKKVSLEGHGHHPEFAFTFVYRSDDEGKTWRRSEGEVFGWLQRGWANSVQCDEPSIEELRDGRLMMMMRSTIGRLMQSFSEDGGRRWTIAEPSPLASSNSPCVLRKIPQTGDLVCVWNQVSPDEIRRGLQRSRLSAAITPDGRTWKHFRTLERHGRMDEIDRIEPEESILMCRSLDDVGDLPPERGCSDYPTVAAHGDDVIISYPHVKGIAHDLVSAMKIRVLPLDWFYAAP